jgi:hypothetical protein
MPCGPCTKSYPPLACQFVHEGKAVLDARSEVAALEQHEPVIRASSSHDAPAHADNSTANAARLAELERSVSMLQNRVKELEKDRSVGSELTQGSTDRPETLIPPLAPHLNSSKQETKLFGSTHWAHVFQEVSPLLLIMSLIPLTRFSSTICEASAARPSMKVAPETK